MPHRLPHDSQSSAVLTRSQAWPFAFLRSERSVAVAVAVDHVDSDYRGRFILVVHHSSVQQKRSPQMGPDSPDDPDGVPDGEGDAYARRPPDDGPFGSVSVSGSVAGDHAALRRRRAGRHATSPGSAGSDQTTTSGQSARRRRSAVYRRFNRLRLLV